MHLPKDMISDPNPYTASNMPLILRTSRPVISFISLLQMDWNFIVIISCGLSQRQHFFMPLAPD